MSDTIYTVIKGDTATKITKKFNISLDVFKKLNSTIKDVNKLSIGQKVKVGEEEYLIFIEEESAEAMVDIQYSFKKIDGTLINGISDSFGKTNILLSDINSGGELIELALVNPLVSKIFEEDVL